MAFAFTDSNRAGDHALGSGSRRSAVEAHAVAMLVHSVGRARLSIGSRRARKRGCATVRGCVRAQPPHRRARCARAPDRDATPAGLAGGGGPRLSSLACMHRRLADAEPGRSRVSRANRSNSSTIFLSRFIFLRKRPVTTCPRTQAPVLLARYIRSRCDAASCMHGTFLRQLGRDRKGT